MMIQMKTSIPTFLVSRAISGCTMQLVLICLVSQRENSICIGSLIRVSSNGVDILDILANEGTDLCGVGSTALVYGHCSHSKSSMD